MCNSGTDSSTEDESVSESTPLRGLYPLNVFKQSASTTYSLKKISKALTRFCKVTCSSREISCEEDEGDDPSKSSISGMTGSAPSSSLRIL